MILNIFKIGGSIVDNDDMLDKFAQQIAKVEGRKLVVHGGGKIASKVSEQIGLEVRMHKGRRITDEQTLRVIIMTYAGLVNKKVVAKLQAHGMNAVGLTGADGNVIQAHKRRVGEIDKETDYGFAGDIDQINPELLLLLLQNKFVPIIAPLTHDKNGQLLNTNADTIAAQLAGSLSSHFDITLVYLMDLPGVLTDINDHSSIIPELGMDKLGDYLDKGIISHGMIPKLMNAATAIESGVEKVYITDITSLSKIEQGAGTRIINN